MRKKDIKIDMMCVMWLCLLILFMCTCENDTMAL